MGLERPKKKVQLWKKAMVHFALCFVMGFFTGFAPTGKPSVFSNRVVVSLNDSEISPPPHRESTSEGESGVVVNQSLIAETPMQTATRSKQPKEQEEYPTEELLQSPMLPPRRLVIIVTPTSSIEKYQGMFLRRLANTIKLVPPPLLWIVVEGQSAGTDEVSEILRRTGIMYRHLMFKENFTDAEAQLDQQRNVALKHIDHHKLSGIVHFAELSNVYDLSFFDDLREIEGSGTWPMALLSPNKNKVIIEGPVCDSSQVIGWHLKKMNNNETDRTRPPIHISSFAFNSSILWDPERWGRSSSFQHTSQNSVKFVKQVALEDETKLKGIPPGDCSKIMLWRLQFSR